MEKSFSIPVSRRDFMKMAGMAAAGAIAGNVGVPGAEAADETTGGGTVKYAGRKIPVIYDMDVCVVGEEEDGCLVWRTRMEVSEVERLCEEEGWLYG